MEVVVVVLVPLAAMAQTILRVAAVLVLLLQ
jgi:hypothetical protein